MSIISVGYVVRSDERRTLCGLSPKQLWPEENLSACEKGAPILSDAPPRLGVRAKPPVEKQKTRKLTSKVNLTTIQNRFQAELCNNRTMKDWRKLRRHMLEDGQKQIDASATPN